MPTNVHVANTDVEFEYASASNLSLKRSWSRHSLCLQLQYLPLLYSDPLDLVAVTEFPSDDYLSNLEKTKWWPEGLPRMILLSETNMSKGLQCLSWGPSLRVKNWAQERGISYSLPSDWNQVCLINSKTFSFRYSTLREAALLADEKELSQWLGKISGNKVLKSCYGLSGIGNRRCDALEPTSELLAFCQKEWRQGRPVVGEPWLDRILDFSTQWKVNQDRTVDYIGATVFETDADGAYQGTLAGPQNLLFGSYEPFLEEHKQFVQKALEEVMSMGFFGNIGFDALLYRDSERHFVCLYPLVEINARKTMSLVALLIQKRLCPRQSFKLYFRQNTSNFPSLLPDRCLDDKGKLVSFRRSLTGEILM